MKQSINTYKRIDLKYNMTATKFPYLLFISGVVLNKTIYTFPKATHRHRRHSHFNVFIFPYHPIHPINERSVLNVITTCGVYVGFCIYKRKYKILFFFLYQYLIDVKIQQPAINTNRIVIKISAVAEHFFVGMGSTL